MLITRFSNKNFFKLRLRNIQKDDRFNFRML